MAPRVRLGLWALAVVGCGLSPVLFRFGAPWAGAAWQCACLGGILALYATTPRDAIRLPRWVSRLLIVGVMVAVPGLCYGQVTWAMGVVPAVVLLFDHLALAFTRPEGGKGIQITARWSWNPGVASDWLATILLWSPAMWMWLAGRTPTQKPEFAVMGTMMAVGWLFVLQLVDGAPVRGGPRERLGVACVFLVIGLGAVLAYATSPGM